MLAEPAVHGSSSALDRGLDLVGGPGPVAHFVNTVAPGEVLNSVHHCLPTEGPVAVLHLVRAELKPGRKLTAEYDVVLPPTGLQRRIAVTWVAAGTTPPARPTTGSPTRYGAASSRRSAGHGPPRKTAA